MTMQKHIRPKGILGLKWLHIHGLKENSSWLSIYEPSKGEKDTILFIHELANFMN